MFYQWVSKTQTSTLWRYSYTNHRVGFTSAEELLGQLVASWTEAECNQKLENFTTTLERFAADMHAHVVPRVGVIPTTGLWYYLMHHYIQCDNTPHYTLSRARAISTFALRKSKNGTTSFTAPTQDGKATIHIDDITMAWWEKTYNIRVTNDDVVIS